MTKGEEIMLFTLKDILEITRMSKSSIYRMMNKGEFPKSISLGGNCVRWRVSEIRKWVTELT